MADPITSASFADTFVPAPPTLTQDTDPQKFLEDVSAYLGKQWYAMLDMQSSIAAGWLIETVRIIDLEAGTITAGSIFTQDLYVGEDQLIVLGGSTNTIEVRDEALTLRVRIGDLGVGATNWGAEFWNSAGTLIMSIGDAVFLDGAIINDATLTGAKLVNATITGSKVGSNTITNSNIASGLSASKVTTGTLTVSSTTVAIDVTGGGAVTLRNGADLIFKAAASGNTNYVDFQNSSGTSRAQISLNGATNFAINTVTGTTFTLTSGGELSLISGADIVLNPGGGFSIYLGLTSADTVSFGGRIATNIIPTAHKVHNIGSAALAFDEAWADNWNNVADIRFQNGMVILEADKVYQGLAGEIGEFWLGPNKKPVMLVGGDGNLYIKGKIIMDVDFDARYAEYKPIDYHKRLKKNEERKKKELRQIELNREATRARQVKRFAKFH